MTDLPHAHIRSPVADVFRFDMLAALLKRSGGRLFIANDEVAFVTDTTEILSSYDKVREGYVLELCECPPPPQPPLPDPPTP